SRAGWVLDVRRWRARQASSRTARWPVVWRDGRGRLVANYDAARSRPRSLADSGESVGGGDPRRAPERRRQRGVRRGRGLGAFATRRASRNVWSVREVGGGGTYGANVR